MPHLTRPQPLYNNASTCEYVAPSDRPYAVVVPRPAARTKTGGIYKRSRTARIREARALRPDLAEYGVREIRYGTIHSLDTLVIFSSELGPTQGLN